MLIIFYIAYIIGMSKQGILVLMRTHPRDVGLLDGFWANELRSQVPVILWNGKVLTHTTENILFYFYR